MSLWRAPEARSIFAQINELHRNLENLQFAIGALDRGEGAEFKFGATPSIGHAMAPLAVADLRRRYPDLLIDLDILKLEDAIDFLLLGRGEVAAVEQLGGLSYVRLAAPDMTIQLAGQTGLAAGHTAAITLPSAAIHVFDGQGAALPRHAMAVSKAPQPA